MPHGDPRPPFGVRVVAHLRARAGGQRVDRARGVRRRRGQGQLDGVRQAGARGQRGRAALGDQRPAVDHVHVPAQLLDLGQVVRGEQHAHAVAGQIRDDRAQVARDRRVQPEGRLVQQQVRRLVDQAARDAQPLPHAPRVALDQRVGGVDQPDQGQQVVGAPAQDRAGHVVQLPEVPEVLPAGQPRVDHPLAAGDQVDAAPDRAGVRDHVQPVHGRRPRGRPQQGREHLDGRGLAGAVEPEQAGDGAGGIFNESPSTAGGPAGLRRRNRRLRPGKVLRRSWVTIAGVMPCRPGGRRRARPGRAAAGRARGTPGPAPRTPAGRAGPPTAAPARASPLAAPAAPR